MCYASSLFQTLIPMIILRSTNHLSLQNDIHHFALVFQRNHACTSTSHAISTAPSPPPAEFIARSQSRIVPSSEPEATTLPEGWYLTHLTQVIKNYNICLRFYLTWLGHGALWRSAAPHQIACRIHATTSHFHPTQILLRGVESFHSRWNDSYRYKSGSICMHRSSSLVLEGEWNGHLELAHHTQVLSGEQNHLYVEFVRSADNYVSVWSVNLFAHSH